MKKDKGLIKIDSIKSIAEFLQQPTLKIAEALTGILASDLRDIKLSAGRLVQASIKFKLFTQLGKELKEYIKKGKIKENYYATHKNQASLSELLKFIDEEIPDEERFKAMKSIFFTSVSRNAPEKDEELTYELMQICKKLTSGEILILKAVYDIVNNRFAANMPSVDLETESASTWLEIIASQIGHNMSSLIEMHEQKLIGLKLITDRRYSDRSGIVKTPHFRLTQLGYKLCQFITKYK